MTSTVTQVGGSRHAIEPPAIESGCSGLACEVNTMVAVVLVLGALTLGAVAFLRCVRHARQACEFEHDRLIAEYQAFLEFADRVANLSVAPRPDGGQPQSGPLVTEASNQGLKAVERAYRDTVMDVPHYDSDYDEPLEKHMATELSPELASAVSQGTQLTPAIKQPLVHSARSAARDRRILADQLDDEREDLEDAEEQLSELAKRFEVTDGDGLLDRTFPDLQSRWERLGDLETDCRDLLERRQSQLRERAPGGGSELATPDDVSTYLYGDLDVDFPVLDAGTQLLERIQTERRETVKALTERRR